MALMLRHKRTGEITPATSAMRREDAYEQVEVELHRLLYRTDADGLRYDRFGNCLDAAPASSNVGTKPRRKRRSAATEDLLGGLD